MTHYMSCQGCFKFGRVAGFRFLSGVFSRCERESGRIDGSNGNTFDSTGSEQSLAESKRTCGDIFRLPGGAR